ncbi:MAG: HAD family hydrolase [Candidatus Hydrogenedentes bacterium]|nr:HAD family hydrolase [Candidatus Hydrogenedentota bacterium]
MSGIQAITFDFWNTLFREDNREERHRMRCEGFAARTGVALDRVLEVQGEVHAEFFRTHVREQRTLNPVDAVRMTATRLGVALGETDETELTELFATAIYTFPPVPIEGALDAVRAAQSHVPVAVISDSGMNPGYVLRRFLDEHGFTGLLTAAVFSDEEGVAKPHPRMFHAAAEKLGVAPQALLHIGDLDPTDIVGVQRLGGQGALFTAVNSRFAETTTAEHTFACWAAFRDALPGLMAG